MSFVIKKSIPIEKKYHIGDILRLKNDVDAEWYDFENNVRHEGIFEKGTRVQLHESIPLDTTMMMCIPLDDMPGCAFNIRWIELEDIPNSEV